MVISPFVEPQIALTTAVLESMAVGCVIFATAVTVQPAESVTKIL